MHYLRIVVAVMEAIKMKAPKKKKGKTVCTREKLKKVSLLQKRATPKLGCCNRPRPSHEHMPRP